MCEKLFFEKETSNISLQWLELLYQKTFIRQLLPHRTQGNTSAGAEEKGKRVTDILTAALFVEVSHPVAWSRGWMKNKSTFQE